MSVFINVSHVCCHDCCHGNNDTNGHSFFLLKNSKNSHSVVNTKWFIAFIFIFIPSRFLLSEKDCYFIRNYIIRNGNFVLYSHSILLIFQRNCFVYKDKISLVYSMTNKV